MDCKVNQKIYYFFTFADENKKTFKINHIYIIIFMKIYPIAKINLGLNIVARRPDGYHDLETVFYPIPLSDELEIENVTLPSSSVPSIELTFGGDKIEGNPKDNLVVKVFDLMSKHFQITSCKVNLTKHIPSQAGMGGGSSDAAAMIIALNELNKLNLSIDKMRSLASQIGADCAFFITKKPLFAKGIGNIFEDVNINSDISDRSIVIVKPPIAVSTRDAYACVRPVKPKVSCKEIVAKPISEWKEMLINDFEKTVFEKFPEIGFIKQRLYDQGAEFVQMSGSGSAVYALFKTMPKTNLKSLFADCFVDVISKKT